MKKRISIIIFIISILFVFQIITKTNKVNAEVISGTVEGVTWTIDTDAGTAVFSGTGKMLDEISDGIEKDKAKAVTTVKIDAGITGIENDVFEKFDNITIVEIPKTATEFDEYIFFGCNKLTTTKWGDITITYNAENDSVIVSGTGKFEAPLESFIPTNQFNLKSIKIENGITSIDNAAFGWCSKIESIEIPNTVTSIGKEAFAGCESLTSIKIPSSVTSIGEKAFSKCINLESIELPDSITSIGKEAFYQCEKLNSIVLPQNLSKIETSVFFYCKALKEIKVHKNIEEIELDAFYMCESLEKVEIENSETDISFTSFNGCSKINQVKVGTSELKIDRETNAITIIGNGKEFDIDITDWYISKSEVKSIKIESGIESIEYSAFTGYTALTDLEIGEGVTKIKGNLYSSSGPFSGCTSLTNVKLPNSLEEIGENAFKDCTSLTNIEIPEGLEKIHESAFDGCENLVLKCKKDSYLQEYAEDNDIKYEIIYDSAIQKFFSNKIVIIAIIIGAIVIIAVIILIIILKIRKKQAN